MKYLRVLSLLAICLSFSVATAEFPVLTGQSLARSDVAMNHQGGVVFQLGIRYDGPDDEAAGDIMDAALGFLSAYPNTTDYFEIVNRNLNRHLRKNFEGLEHVDVCFEIEPRHTVPFVVLSRSVFESGRLTEYYGFHISGAESAHPLLRGTELRAWYRYKPNLAAPDIPNVLYVHRDAVEWLLYPPDEIDSISALEQDLAAFLTAQYDNIDQAWISITPP